jgi:exopolysaccharide production protein ExoZ
LVFTWLNWKQHFISIDDVVTFSIPAALVMIGLAAIDLRRKVKIPALLTYLGAASYSIFLTNLEFTSIQYKLIKYFHWTASVETGIPLLFTIIITAMMGCLVYKVVEKPIFMVLRPQTAQESLQRQKPISAA